MLDLHTTQKLADRYGEAFYLYDESGFEANFRNMLAAFNHVYPHTKIAYSYKTNYTPDICRLVDTMGGYAEVVSEMEYHLAKRIGVHDKNIVYNGPYKSSDSLRTALLAGAMVNLDSLRDLKGLLAVAQDFPDRQIKASLRCNFKIKDTFTSRFGFDVESSDFSDAVAALRSTRNVQLAGLHCHFPDRDLDSYTTRVSRMLELSDRLFIDEPPEFISIGGGYFGIMPDSLKSSFTFVVPSYEDYAAVIGGLFLDAFRDCTRKPVLFIEPGTALVADTFEFYTKIIDVKSVRGRRIATVSGSIFNINPVSRSTNLPVTLLSYNQSDVGDVDTFDVAGFTCIESDYLSTAVKGNAGVGDFLAYSNVGSYSVVMKPPFILPNYAILKKSRHDGQISVIRDKETNDYIFQNFKDYPCN